MKLELYKNLRLFENFEGERAQQLSNEPIVMKLFTRMDLAMQDHFIRYVLFLFETGPLQGAWKGVFVFLAALFKISINERSQCMTLNITLS